MENILIFSKRNKDRERKKGRKRTEEGRKERMKEGIFIHLIAF